MKNWSGISKYRDELFGVSIISIIIFHLAEAITNSPQIGKVYYQIAQMYCLIVGSIGVEIFLFLSGMGLYFSMRKNYNLKYFYTKRLKRVVVPYLIWGALFWSVKDLIILNLGINKFLLDYSLISFWLDGQKSLWYIALTVLLYLFFPVIYKLFNCGERRRVYRTFLICLTIVAVTIGLKLFFQECYLNIEIAVTRIVIFLLGVFCSKFIFEQNKFTLFDGVIVYTGVVIKIVGLVIKYEDMAFAGVFTNRFAIAWFAIGLVCLIVIILEKVSMVCVHDFFNKTGALSLELYMTHVSVRAVMQDMGIETYKIQNYFICIAIAIVLSVLLQRIIEIMKV